MAKQIEIFTAGTYLCENIVQQVKQLACSKCEISVYNLNENSTTNQSEQKAKKYGTHTVPSVIMEGKLVDHTLLRK